MTRVLPARLVALAAAVLFAASLFVAVLGGGARPHTKAADGGWWFCVAVQEINFGYCQGNPLG